LVSADQQWKQRNRAEGARVTQCVNECVAISNVDDGRGGEDEASSCWWATNKNMKPDLPETMMMGKKRANAQVKEMTGNAHAFICSAKVTDAVVSGEAIKVAGDGGGKTIPFVAESPVVKAKAAIDGYTDACVSGEIDPVRGAEQASVAENIEQMNEINVGGCSREEGVIANTVSKLRRS
jgi:hypothetical protein